MKFTVNRQAFIQKLRDVQLAISSQTTIPILTGLKLTILPDGVELAGSNADISIETFLDARDEDNGLTIEGTGALVLQPARFFSNIINKLPDETFTFEVKEGTMAEITSATSEFKVNGLAAENYPYLPEMDAVERFRLPVATLQDVIRQTVISVSPHESRPILTGVKFDLEDGRLSAVATDSHRLSQRQLELAEVKGVSDSVVIPGTSLTELTKLLGEDLEEVEVAINENQILFKTADTNFYSRLLEGNYPATDQLIPTETNTQVTVRIDALRGAVERASLLSHAGRNNVVQLTIDSDVLRITGESSEVGSVVEDIPYTSITGDALDISFNPDYLKQALQTFSGTEVTLEFLSSLRPFIVVPALGENKTDFVQLITPIRTRQ